MESVAQTAKFQLGQQVMTRGVFEEVQADPVFAAFVARSAYRHSQGDWGDLDEEDKAANDAGMEGEGDRLLSSYNQEGLPNIWIITEWDRSVTTVLFPSEY